MSVVVPAASLTYWPSILGEVIGIDPSQKMLDQAPQKPRARKGFASLASVHPETLSF
jgi:hypothetical protein